jgi:hypothetical protein
MDNITGELARDVSLHPAIGTDWIVDMPTHGPCAWLVPGMPDFVAL